MIINTVLSKLRVSDSLRAGDLPIGRAGGNLAPERVIFSGGGLDSSSPIPPLVENLTSLAQLVANIIEAYTTVIFLADKQSKSLTVGSYHTLSREFINYTRIGYGSGLIGWTAENKNRVSVCPFENDSSTLLYYLTDQNLKSFISIPILDSKEELLGVLACDSKKTYAFSKTTEKILYDCAKQAATLIELHRHLDNYQNLTTLNKDLLLEFIEKLRTHESEEELLNEACQIPQEIIRYEALVLLAIAENGLGNSTYYSISNNRQVNHHLLEHVCRNKRIICGGKSVHVTSSGELKDRSFLSVPFRFLSREAGSFNIVGPVGESFSSSQVQALELISKVIGKELERIRLCEHFLENAGSNGILSWKTFKLQAETALNQTKTSKQSLIRIDFDKLGEIERKIGIEATLLLVDKVTRLVEQLKGHDAIACRVYGTRIFILTNKSEISAFTARFQKLVEKINLKDLGLAETFRDKIMGKTPGSLLLNGTIIYTAHFPRDGETLAELCSRLEHLAQQVKIKKDKEIKDDVRAWA